MGKFKKGDRVKILAGHPYHIGNDDTGLETTGVYVTKEDRGWRGKHHVLAERRSGMGTSELSFKGSEIELLVETTPTPRSSPHLTFGDRATALDGEQVTIDSEVDALDHVWVVNTGGKRWRTPVSWLSAAWVPKVGDRVRLVKDGLSTTGAIGKLATIEAWSDGSVVDDGEYLLNIDGPVDYETRAFTENYTRATIDCFVLVAAEAQPAGLQIEAGKFYRTRDGRKVGPMRRGTSTSESFYWVAPETDSVFGSAWHQDGIFHPKSSPYWTKTSYGFDLVAEWINEPVVAVEEVEVSSNAPPAKFKVGDRVNWTYNRDSWQDVEVVEVRDSGSYPISAKHDVYGTGDFPLDELELATPPANDNTITLTLNIDTKPVADALRTIAAALTEVADKIGEAA